MMKWAAFLLAGLIGLCCAPIPVWANDGSPLVQDLRQWSPGEGETMALSGPWELYWERLLAPGDFSSGTAVSASYLSVSVPAQWSAYSSDGQALSNEGYATYRLTFLLSGETAGKPLGLYVNNIASAYRLWINGMPVDANGVVGETAEYTVPRSYPKAFFFVPQPGRNELIIQVSNFNQRTGGIWENLELGNAESIASLHRNRVMVWTFLTGCLLLMTLFSLFLYLFRKQERAALWFGLICLAICIRSSLLGESFIYVLLPGLSWEWGVKLEYLSEIVTIGSLAAFVNKQYPHESIRLLLPIFAVALGGFGGFVLAAPAQVYTKLMLPYVISLLLPVFFYVMYVYIRAALRGRTGSRCNMLGFTVFFAAVIHEIMYYTGFVPLGGFVPFGLLFFLLTQLLNLSLLFTRAVTRSELLSAELNQVIASQEKTIRQRTSSLQELNRQLERGNQELSRIEEIRSSLLAEVYHDLTTPITAIKGFSKAIKTAVIPEQEAPVYAGRIYERSLLLEKLIDNVIELSQLKTGEIQLELADTSLLPYLRQLSQRYAAETADQGIPLLWEEPQYAVPSDQQLQVRLDRFRFERVFANLISNAVKYTPGEGVIRVWTEFRPAADLHAGYAVIHVTDSGSGIPESELPHIFKRRYRIAAHRQGAAGSGLGLAICKEIVSRHQGEIGVTSLPGEGSDFYITMPAKVGIPPRDAAPHDAKGEEDGDDHFAD